MTSKKTAKSKLTNPPREFTRTKEFQKDWQRLAHSGRYDMNNLKEAMLLLIENAAPLPAEWLDHPKAVRRIRAGVDWRFAGAKPPCALRTENSV
jgi:hypothetical protein